MSAATPVVRAPAPFHQHVAPQPLLRVQTRQLRHAAECIQRRIREIRRSLQCGAWLYLDLDTREAYVLSELHTSAQAWGRTRWRDLVGFYAPVPSPHAERSAPRSEWPVALLPTIAGLMEDLGEHLRTRPNLADER